MEFQDQHEKAIYLQIAEHICEQILRKELLAGDKIPSVRDLAMSIMVNPNTVVRTYAYLEDKNIIEKQRGIGYFLTQNAYNTVLQLKKSAFIEQDLPRILRKMSLLNISFAELKNLAKTNN